MRGVLVAVGLALALSGCVTVPHLSARDVPAGSPSSGGAGPALWRVSVVDEQGQPLAEAQVVAYWLDGRQLPYVQLRTDSTGMAQVRAPAGRNVTFAAAAPEYTEDWVLSRGSTDGAEIRLVLLPKHLRFNLTGEWTGVGDALDPLCQFQRLQYSTGEAAVRFQDRFTALDITLVWTNGVPQGVADWEIGAYFPRGLDFSLSQCPQPEGRPGEHALPGPQSERRTLSQSELGDAQDFLADGTVWLGPVNRGGTLAAGMPYTMEINATLERDITYRAQGSKEFRNAVPVLVAADGTWESTAQPGLAAGASSLLVVGLAFAALVRRRNP